MKGLVKRFMERKKMDMVQAKEREEARGRVVKQIEEMGIDLKEYEILLADGFEDAFVGVVERCASKIVACYDKQKCLEILEKQGLNPLDAVEYFEYNVIGAWMGDYTPYFLTRGFAGPLGKQEQLRLVGKTDASKADAPADAPAEK